MTDAPTYAQVRVADAVTVDHFRGVASPDHSYVDVAQQVQEQEQEIAGALFDQHSEEAKRLADLSPPRPSRPAGAADRKHDRTRDGR